MNVEPKRVQSRITDPQVLLQILDMLPTSIFVKNEQLQFEFSNDAHCNIIGVAPDGLLGHSDADFYPDDEAGPFLFRDNRVLETGEVSECEEVATNTKSGITSPYLTRKSKITTADGKVYLIGTNTNLTEIKKREEQYRTLAETVPVGIWHVREDGSTIYVNPLMCELLGKPAATVCITHPAALLGAQHADIVENAIRFETDIALPEGFRRRVLAVSSGLRAAPGSNSKTAIISIVDITELSELQRINEEISRLNRELADNMHRLKEAQDEIVKRGKMAQLGQLTATVAHELRNPLGAIRTSAFLVERKLKDKNLGVEQQLQRISHGIQRCDNIITQLLDFARSKALHCETDNFDAWLAKLVEEEARKLPDAVRVECDLGLSGALVPFDAERMSRVFINLISNASEAMVGKGDDPSKFTTASPKITITTYRSVRGVEVVVADNGPGIPPEIMKKILEPLFTTKNFGTGLGLPAVERILEQHGGGLDIHSAAGAGAQFIAWFPNDVRNEEAA